MTIYDAPVQHSLFALSAVLSEQRWGSYPADDVLESILSEAGRFAAQELHPLNAVGDREGCRLTPDGRVCTPTGFKAAFAKFADGGWTTLAGPEEYGGQEMANTIGAALQEYWVSANMGFAQYYILTHSAVATLNAAGSVAQKQLYLPHLVSGKWTGAMSLTEPHCGTDLGLIKTKAVVNTDGTYRIAGTKIFISAGDQDLTENIVHLVLARIEGAPAGVAGLSLFIVPKMLTDDNGRMISKNGISCTALEHKMGIRASATCMLYFESATGYLVGEENKGLASMFLMMNETRLTTGVQGVAMAEIAYQNALCYALDRRQGRSAKGAIDTQAPADRIIVHPDVRRMLMDMRAFTESARALAFWTAALADRARHDPSLEEKQKSAALLGLMTPIVKAYLTDICLARTIDAQQIYGGHGYITDYGMEQFVRDARISQIYEGTNGIQAMDLIGRKFVKDGGRTLSMYLSILRADCDMMPADSQADVLRSRLNSAVIDLEQSADYLLRSETGIDDYGSVAHDFLHLIGTVALGHMWVKLATAALLRKRTEPENLDFFDNRIKIARYFAERSLPETRVRRARIEAGGAANMALSDEGF